jgi:hypothetical protein
MRLVLLPAALLLAAFPLGAQVVRGTLTEELSGRPVHGGLAQLIGPRGVAASAVTDERGRFLLPEVAPGSYRLRALRIGYRPWTSDSFTLGPGEERTFTLVIPSVPVLLDELVAQGTSPCRARPESDRRVTLLWDEARTSLGLLGGGRAGLEYFGVLTRRRLDPAGKVNFLDTYPSLSEGAWPVTSVAAESLAAAGFVQVRDTVQGPVYYGPDVAAFFSDAFVATHCFRLVAPPRRERHLVGVGFAPARGRRLPEIEGTLWLDRRTGALVRLEYHYVNLWRWVPERSAGGVLEFARLADGTPVMTGWKLTAPIARRLPWTGRVEDGTREYFGGGEVTLQGFSEEGVEVREVRLGTRVLWKRAEAGTQGPGT